MRGNAGVCILSLLLVLAVALVGPAAAQTGGGEADGAAQTLRQRSPALDHQYQRALTAWRTGASLFEAKARLDRVLKTVPTDADARKLRAEVLMEMGRPEQALDDARRATELHPEDGEAHLLHAEAARKSSQLDAARRALDAAAETLPEDAALHTRLSWNALLLDRPAQAEAFARVALALDATAAPSYRQLARVFLQQDRPDEAASVLARGLRAGVLTPRTIREDDQLRALAGHARLSEWMQP